MHQLVSDDAIQWCLANGLQIVEGGTVDRLRVAGPESYALQLSPARDAADALDLTYRILLTDVADYDEESFPGGLVWLQRWELWSETLDRVGYRLVSALRHGDATAPLAAAPAQMFGDGDLVDAQAFAAVAMVFQWDFHWIPRSARFLAFSSHDAGVRFRSRDRHMHGTLLQRFAEWNPLPLP